MLISLGKSMYHVMVFSTLLLACRVAHAHDVNKTVPKPKIEKRGTLKADVVETTPFQFKGKVYRLEWEREGAFSDRSNQKGFLRIVNRETEDEVSRFAEGYRFPCAYAEEDQVYVVGTKTTDRWYGKVLTMFTSEDLKTWESYEIYNDPKIGLCNTSLCKAQDRYVLSIELATTGGFPARFMESKDLKSWTVMSPEHGHSLGRYNAAHCLRWHDGWFYLFYLEANKPGGYEQYITRSRDLKTWEPSPLNPVLTASEEDRHPIGKHLTDADRKKLASATDKNNSDIDFCEHNGRLIINYSWGNQQGTEFLAEAIFQGREVDFLTGWFPTPDQE